MNKISALILTLAISTGAHAADCHRVANATLAAYELAKLGVPMFEMMARINNERADEGAKEWKRVFIRSGYDLHERGFSQAQAYETAYGACRDTFDKPGREVAL